MATRKFINPVTKEIYEVPDEDIASAEAHGLRPLTEDDVKVEEAIARIREKAPKWLPESLAVFGAQALDEFMLGAAEAYFDYATDDPFLLEAKNRIKEEHAVANTLGGVMGFVGSFAYGGPLFKLGSKAVGRVTTSTALKTAGGLTTEVAATSALPRAAEVAGKIHHDLSSEDNLYYNPDAGAFALVTDGLAELTENVTKDTIAGLLIGGGVSAFAMGASKAYRKIRGKSKGNPKTIPNMDYNSASAGETAFILGKEDDQVYKMIDDLRIAIANNDTVAAQKLEDAIVSKAKTRLKQNADDILEAAKTFNVDPMPEALLKLNDPLVDHYVVTYGTSNTEAGRIKQLQVDETFRKIQNKVESEFDFGRFTGDGERVVLTEARQNLAEAIVREANAFGDEYAKLDKLWKQAVDADDFKRLTSTLAELSDTYAFSPQLSQKIDGLLDFVTKRAEQRGSVTLNDIQRIRQSIRNWYNEVTPTELNMITAKIDDVSEKVIRDTSVKRGVEDLFLKKQVIDEAYADFKRSLEEVGDRLSPIGSQSNKTVILESLMRVDDQTLIDRVTSTKSIALRNALEKFNLKNVVHDLGDLKLYRQLQRGMVDGEFNVRSFVNSIKDLRKDYTTFQQVFGDKAKILNDAVTYIESLPSNYTSTRFTSNVHKILREVQTSSRFIEGGLDVVQTLAEKGILKGANEYLMNLPRAALNKLNSKKAESVQELMQNIVDFARGVRKPSTTKDVSAFFHLSHEVKKKGKQLKNLISNGIDDVSPFDRLTNYYLRAMDRRDEAEERAKKRLESYSQTKQVLLDNFDELVANQLVAAETTSKDAIDAKLNEALSDISNELPMTSAVVKTQGTGLNQILLAELMRKKEETGPFSVANTVGTQLTDVEKQKIVDALAASLFPDVTLSKIVSNKATPFEIASFTTSYPKLAESIAQKILSIEKEKASGRPISLGTKITLSLLLGRPVDSQYDPLKLRALQVAVADVDRSRTPTYAAALPKRGSSVKIPTAQSNVERIEFRR